MKAIKRFFVYVLSDFIRDQLANKLATLTYPTGSRDYENFVESVSHIVRMTIPADCINLLREMKLSPSPPGAILFKNLPIDNTLPPTPAEGLRKEYLKLTSISEGVTIGFASQIGETYGFEEEKGGELIHDIVPVHSSGKSLSNKGWKVSFDFHSENAYFSNRPAFLALFCLRAGPGKSAVTRVADIRDALAHLSPNDIRALRQPLFQIRTPYILDECRPPGWSKPCAVLSGSAAVPNVRVSFYKNGTISQDNRGIEALSNLKLAFEHVKRDYRLEKSDLLLLNGKTTVHGRNSWQPKFDGSDRWIQRTYILNSFWPYRDQQLNSLRILSPQRGQRKEIA